jgi:hypothetical protein
MTAVPVPTALGIYSSKLAMIYREYSINSKDSQTCNGKMALLDQTYSKLMQNHPYGTALYKPQSSRNFHPGSIGYFDAVGNWNPVADLTSGNEGLSTVFSPFPSDQLVLAPEQTQTWGPKVGQQTTCRMIDLKQSVSLAMVAGIPADVGSCFRFENSDVSGSVLLVQGPVVHRRYYHESPFKRWVADNEKAILAARPEVIEYGLWVVTSTWSASEVAVNCWREQRRGVDVGFNVRVVEIGELAPKGAWFNAGEADGWIKVTGSEVRVNHQRLRTSRNLPRD